MAELDLRKRGVVSGDMPGPLAGVVGYDVLARTIVQFPAKSDHTAPPAIPDGIPPSPRERKRARQPAASDVQLWPPFRSRRDMPPWMAALPWQPIRVVRLTPLSSPFALDAAATSCIAC